MKKLILTFILLALVVSAVAGCQAIDEKNKKVGSQEDAKETVEDVSVNLDEVSKDLDSVSEDLG